MKKILLTLTLLASTFPALSLSCEEAVSKSLSRSGLSPAQYFEQHSIAGRPRFVLTIGLTGSGKSSWAEAGRKRGWTLISADQLRVDHLKSLAEQRRFFELRPNYWVKADPKDPRQVFSEKLREWAYQRASEILTQALQEKRPIIWDATNIDWARVPKIYEARAAGYFVEGLVFKSSDISINERNLELRAKQGGLRVGNDCQSSRDILQLLQHRWNAFPVENSRVDPEYFQNRHPLPPVDAHHVNELRSFDVFNRLEWIDVRDWSLPQ